MTLLTGETDVFAAAASGGRCAVMFIAKRQSIEERIYGAEHVEAIERTLARFASEGWLLSIRAMFQGGDATSAPMALDTGFAHDVDVAGVFEAPSIDAALKGTVRLEQAGWSRLFTTEWLIGPREFATVNGIGEQIDRPWGFLALWEWNDQWTAASPEERRAYDLECDVAFKSDLGLNVNIAGRHRLDWAHAWHHLGVWEAASLEIVDEAMRGHEHAADFMFTTSRHVVGRVRPLRDLIAMGARR
jgi:hypothetical protein